MHPNRKTTHCAAVSHWWWRNVVVTRCNLCSHLNYRSPVTSHWLHLWAPDAFLFLSKCLRAWRIKTSCTAAPGHRGWTQRWMPSLCGVKHINHIDVSDKNQPEGLRLVALWEQTPADQVPRQCSFNPLFLFCAGLSTHAPYDCFLD